MSVDRHFFFNEQNSSRFVSLIPRPREHWGLKSTKGDSRSLQSRKSPPDLNIKGTSIKTWITAGGLSDPGGVRTGSSGSFQKTGSSVRPLGGWLSCHYNASLRKVASLAVQRSYVLAKKRVLSLSVIRHPLSFFVEKRVRGGPRFQRETRSIDGCSFILDRKIWSSKDPQLNYWNVMFFIKEPKILMLHQSDFNFI